MGTQQHEQACASRETAPPRPRQIVQTTSARYVLIALGSQLTGLSAKAIRRKIANGVWREGREYRRAPDGHLYVDMEGYARWVASKS